MTALRGLLARHSRFLWFLLVGGSGVLVNMAVFGAVLYLWPNARERGTAEAGAVAVNTAAVLGWVVSVFTNFLLNERLTFGDRLADLDTSRKRRLSRYYLSAVVALGMQLAVLNTALWLMAQPAVQPMIPELIATYRRSFGNLGGIAAGTVANYLLASRWVFK